jgi:hypothetical protein
VSAPPVTFLCFECGAALGGHHWRVCAICGHMFCRKHLIVATDTAMCASCQDDAERRDRDARPGAPRRD